MPRALEDVIKHLNPPKKVVDQSECYIFASKLIYYSWLKMQDGGIQGSSREGREGESSRFPLPPPPFVLSSKLKYHLFCN